MILNYICFVIVLFTTILHQVAIFLKITVNKKTYACIMFIFAISVAYLASLISPPANWDLSHHYSEIERMRWGGIEYTINDGSYKELFIINFIFYLVSLLEDNSILVFVVLFIEIVIYTYILVNSNKSVKNFTISGVAFFLFFTLLNIILAISGIRNVLAFSIVSLAVFLDLYQNRKGIIKYMLYIIPVFIHPSVIIVPIIRLLLINKKIIFLSPLLLFWTQLINQISDFFLSINIGAFQTIGGLLKLYRQSEYLPDLRLVAVHSIFLIIFLSLIIKILYKENYRATNMIPTKYTYYVIVYIFTVLGSLSDLIIFNRMLYGLAFLLIPLYWMYEEYLNGLQKIIYKTIFIVYFMGIFLYQFIEFYNVFY